MNPFKLHFLVIAALLAGCQQTPPASSPAHAPAAQADEPTPSAAASVSQPPDPDAAHLRAFIELARKDIQLQKSALIADNMDFTEGEAAEFWPLHRQYEADLAKLNDRR